MYDDNLYYYTFKLHSRSLLVNILQLILNVQQLWRNFCRILCIGRWWRYSVTASKRAKIIKYQHFARLIAWVFFLPHFACILVWLFWMYNKTIIGFGWRMISRIIYPDLGQCYPPQASTDNIDLGLDNSWYHAQPHPIIVHIWSFSSLILQPGLRKAPSG